MLVCICLLFGIAACGMEPETTEPYIESITDLVTLPTSALTEPTSMLLETQDSNVWYLTQQTDDICASVKIPTFSNYVKHEQLIVDYVNAYLNSSGFCNFGLAKAAQGVDGGVEACQYYLDLDCKITFESDWTICLVFEGVFNYINAAHPIRMLFSLYINREDDTRVMFKDIWLVNDAFYDLYLQYAEEALALSLGEEYMGDISVEELCDREGFLAGLETEQEYCVFYTETGVSVSYPVNHALGDYQVAEIPYSALNWQVPYDVVCELNVRESLFNGSFEVIEKGYGGWCRYVDANGDVIEERLLRPPFITMITDEMLCLTVQEGTGLITQWGFFYDCATSTRSETFKWVLDASGDKVILWDGDGVIVRGIYNDVIIAEYREFEDAAMDMAIEWILDAEFSEDGKQITVTYYAGDDYHQAQKVFDLE